jgi:hypothetical protein
LQGTEHQLQTVREVYERGRQHEHCRYVVEEDDAKREDAGRVQALGRDREYSPVPQVVRLGHVSRVEENLEGEDEDEEGEEDTRAPEHVPDGYFRGYAYGDEQGQNYREAAEGVYEERCDDEDQGRCDLYAGVHAVYERARLDELAEDDITL